MFLLLLVRNDAIVRSPQVRCVPTIPYSRAIFQSLCPVPSCE